MLAIDLPGFGHSEGRTDLFSPQAMGRFLVRLIDEWELGAPHVFGPDVGGPAALFAAAESPSSLTSTVIGNGATAYPLDVAGNLKDLIANPDFESLLALDGAEVIRQAMAMHETYEVSAAAMEDYMTGYAGSRFGESARFVRNYPTDLALLEGLLPQIQTPVKIIASDHDPMVPLSNAEYLNKRLPRCELTVLDPGHFAWEDDAAAYGDAALAWLDGGFAASEVMPDADDRRVRDRRHIRRSGVARPAAGGDADADRGGSGAAEVAVRDELATPAAAFHRAPRWRIRGVRRK